MGIRQRLEKLEKKARISRRTDPIDPFELARSGELTNADIHYLCEVFRKAGYISAAEELESIRKEREKNGNKKELPGKIPS
jgi:hypothetical protein